MPQQIRSAKDSRSQVPWYFEEEITSTYESRYGGKYKGVDRLEKAVLKKGIEWIGNVDTILEVGCGTAHFTRWFEEMGIKAYGVDISPFVLKEAKRLWEGGKLARATSSYLPVKDSTVDAVGFITCFEYMPDPVNVILEATRVARNGIFFGLINSWSIPTVRRKIQVALGRNPYYKTAHFYSLPEIKHLIEKTTGKDASLFQTSTVFPRPLPIEESRVPFGAFLCVSLRLNRGAS